MYSAPLRVLRGTGCSCNITSQETFARQRAPAPYIFITERSYPTGSPSDSYQQDFKTLGPVFVVQNRITHCEKGNGIR